MFGWFGETSNESSIFDTLTTAAKCSKVLYLNVKFIKFSV